MTDHAKRREVAMRRVGKKISLERADEWSSEFIAALGSLSEDIERPKAKPIAKKKRSIERARIS